MPPHPEPTHDPVGREEWFSIAEIALFFRRHWSLILALILAGGLAMGLVARFFVQTKYEASATVVVVPLRFASELKPQVFTVQAYQQILESDSVVAQTANRLAEMGALPKPKDTLRVGKDLRTRIFVSRRSEETALAPMIELVAQATSGADAAVIANTWCEVFLEFAKEMASNLILSTITVIEDEYQTAREELTFLESERIGRINGFEKRIDEARVRWDRQLVSFKKETEDHIGEFQNETRKLMQAFAEEQRLTAMHHQPDDRSRQRKLALKLQEILNLRIRLAQIPQILVLEKAVTDDALWQAITLDQGRSQDLRPLVERSLLSQEVNPVHTELASRLLQVEVDTEGLEPADRERVERILNGLEELQRLRGAGLVKLLADRALEFDLLKLKKHQEITELERERSLEIERLDRDLRHQQALFSELATKNNQARLAKAVQTLEEVRLASPAVEPLRPRPRNLALKILLGMIVGGTAGLAWAFVREVTSPRSIRQTSREVGEGDGSLPVP